MNLCTIVGQNRMEKEIPAYGDLCHGHQLPSRWGRKGEQTPNNDRDSHVKNQYSNVINQLL